MEKLITLINRNKYRFNLNLVKLRIGKNKYYFNINQINYEKPELREIKNKTIYYYFHSLKFNNSFKKHFFNHLIALNEDLAKKAKLIKYLLNHRLKIDEISASFLVKNDKNLFSEFNLPIKEVKITNKQLSPISVILWLIKQYKRNHLKRTLFPQCKSNFYPDLKYTKMLRAWFTLSEKIYVNKLKKSFDNTIIYITPYMGNGKNSLRQKKYLQYLDKNRRNYFFYIPKINYFFLTKIAIKIFFSSFPLNFKIPLLHIIKERMEIDDFINFIRIKFPSIEEFYTREEFHPESVYLTERLKELKIKVINSAHGLGVYGTFVDYDIFYVFTKIQQEHYSKLSNSKFELFKSINTLKKESNIKKNIALFFIHQNVLSTPYRKSIDSINIYKELLNYIEKITLDLNITVFAKYHPGSNEKDKILSNNIKIVEKIEDLPNKYNYLATTLHSSYVLELLESMPFLIINPQNKINMKDFFPDDNSFYIKNYNEFKEKILKFQENQKNYYEYWNKLLFSIYKI